MSGFLRMENITKRFPGVTANENVTLEFAKGETHALLGENGAGKTTLMNILYGLIRPDEGKIIINDNEVIINSPSDAIANGIGMVHQHFMLIPKFTVAENIVLGTKLKTEPILDLSAARKKIRSISEKTGLNIDPDAKVSDLSVGDQQRVEIIKALYKGAHILIMDEPTSVLTPQEVDELFIVLKQWTSEGNTVIFITHKMREVLEICDRISVLRDGKYMATVSRAGCDQNSIAELMVGRKVNLDLDKKIAKIGEQIFEVKNLCANNEQGVLGINNASFNIHKGEILGVAGVDGNGQLELVESIMGLKPIKSGDIFFENQSIKGMSTNKRLNLGISNISFRRQTEGLVLNFSVEENLILKERNKEPYTTKWFLNKAIIRKKSEESISKYMIKARDSETKVGNMSGGNQQKVVLARELEREPKLLIACHPTHGLDIGATEFIHKQILKQREIGTGVMLISTELDELFALSDRIIVLYKGMIMGEIIPSQEAIGKIGLMMLGNKIEESKVVF